MRATIRLDPWAALDSRDAARAARPQLEAPTKATQRGSVGVRCTASVAVAAPLVTKTTGVKKGKMKQNDPLILSNKIIFSSASLLSSLAISAAGL